ncbi:MAG: hypothetical protein ACPIOQ_07405, partial [Promethearchaeia archaeon]
GAARKIRAARERRSRDEMRRSRHELAPVTGVLAAMVLAHTASVQQSAAGSVRGHVVETVLQGVAERLQSGDEASARRLIHAAMRCRHAPSHRSPDPLDPASMWPCMRLRV